MDSTTRGHRHGSRAARPLHEVILALMLKACLLAAIYILFFSPAHRPPANPAATANALLGTDAGGSHE